MRSSRLIVAGAFAVGIAAGLVAGCQMYDFEPVRPIIVTQTSIETTVVAKSSKPNLMLLVDKSGSMDVAADPNLAACRLSDGGTCGVNKNPLCPSNCPTRWTELQGAMGDFLSTSGDVARMGLAIFPLDTACGQSTYTPPDGGPAETAVHMVTGIIQSEDVSSELNAQSSNILGGIQAIDPATSLMYPLSTTCGGTPAGKSLQLVGTRSDLNDPNREDFVLLLTDGLPNCNPGNPATPGTPECHCTGSPCTDKRMCLDKDGTVAAINQNLSAGIKTIVVGFGSETATGDGPMTLNAMAAAGGFPRKCFTDGGGCAALDTCDATGVCQNIKFYQASNRAELVAALEAITKRFGTPCDYELSADPQSQDTRFLVVYITEKGKDPVKLIEGPDTYQYVPGFVHLKGATCELVSNATAANPVKVEIRLISAL